MFDRLPHTLDQLPRDAATYYHEALHGSRIFDLVDTGRKDATGARVYEKLFDGEHAGYVALTPYARYAAHVREVAKRVPSMGIPKFYRPVDPETGRYWGEGA